MIDSQTLYKRYGPMVLRRCRALLRDEESAWDALQEVFVLVLRHHRRFQQETGHSSLLYTMATNHCLNVLRARRRKSHSSENAWESHGTADRAFDAVVVQNTVDRIFSLFDDRTRTIAWLYFVDGLTLEETARAAQMSVSGIRKRLRKLQAAGQADEEKTHAS